MEKEQTGSFALRNHEDDVIDKFYIFYLEAVLDFLQINDQNNY